jgi:hypothetical protein
MAINLATNRVIRQAFDGNADYSVFPELDAAQVKVLYRIVGLREVKWSSRAIDFRALHCSN